MVASSTNATISELLKSAQSHYAAGRFAVAESLCGEILGLDAAHHDASQLMAISAFRRGDLPLAIEWMGKVAKARPSHRIYNYLGVFHETQGKPDEAIAHYQHALALKPDDVETYCNLGKALYGRREFTSAVNACRAALAIDPSSVRARTILGVALIEQGESAAAIEHLRAALALAPGRAETNANLGSALNIHGEYEQALKYCGYAASLEPRFLADYSGVLFSLCHTDRLNSRSVYEAHHKFDEYLKDRRKHWLPHDNSRELGRRLRVGFVSGDLRTHPVAELIEAIWASLNPARIDLWAYSNNPTVDEVTSRLQRLAHHWSEISTLSDQALAAKIREDKIDILFDLSGHTRFNRLPVFAMKPAPVQASWIGYPATTGLDAVDYYIADRHMAPIGIDEFFTEKIVRLPAACRFLPYPQSPPVNELPALSHKFLTFGSFNRSAKLGDPVIALWSRVLLAVPDSRILLGSVNDEETRTSLTDRFARSGIGQDRLLFYPRMGTAAYLGLHHQVDLILDTYPYTGGTTSGHALWMGIPVLTLAGKTMPSRQTAALLYHLELSDFVTESADAFVARAVEWSTRLAEMNDIRLGMRDRIADLPTTDASAVARGLEGAIRDMWQRWCNGLPAESFEITS